MEMLADQHGHRLQALNLGIRQKKAYSGTAGTIDNAVGAKTKAIRIVSTTACFYTTGLNPTATSDDVYLPADCVEYVQITPGHKVSAVQVSSAGTLYVVELK